MKKTLWLAGFCLIISYAHAQTKKPLAKRPISTVKKAAAPKNNQVAFASGLDSASYAFGLSFAEDLKKNGITSVNYTLLSKGVKDAFTGSKAVLDATAVRTSINNLFAKANQKKEEAEKIKYAPAIKAGEEFLAKNKTNPNVKTTASGLQYEIITEGTGPKPKATDKVKVNYKGTLLDGTKFDSSYDRGEPASFTLNQVIPGWTEGLQLMNEGSKFKFYIPYNLAYGGREMGGVIKPFSTLVFEVELLKVNPTD